MAENPVRFAILGCAKIAHKLVRAISLSPNTTLVAVSSRSLDKAHTFIADNALDASAVTAYGSYEVIIDNPHIDAVYIPLPTSLHVQWAIAAAENGKHVLLEKPTAVCADDLERILDACSKSGVQFMDGTMWLHHPRTAKMKELVSDAGQLGELKMIHSSSTFRATPEFLSSDIRVKPDLDSLGALGDLGWYCIGAILWAVDYQLPTTVTALPPAQLNGAGVILSCSASMQWQGNRKATFDCSFLSHVTMDLCVQGISGTLLVRDLAIPFQEDSASFEFASGVQFSELHLGWTRKLEEVAVATELPQEALMVSEFCELVRNVRDSGGSPDQKWPEIARKTQVLLDAVKRSIEMEFKPVHL